MDGESLVGIAEVAIVFAGFAGVSVVLGRHQPGSWTYAEAARLACMIESSLTAAFFALLPVMVSSFDASMATTWAVCSAGLALATLHHMALTGARTRRASARDPSELMPVSFRIAMFVLGLLVVLALSLNAGGVLFDRVAGPFVARLLFHLVFAGFMFMRSLTLLRSTTRGDCA